MFVEGASNFSRGIGIRGEEDERAGLFGCGWVVGGVMGRVSSGGCWSSGSGILSGSGGGIGILSGSGGGVWVRVRVRVCG